MQTTITHKRFIIHPYKFNLWVAIGSMVLMFAAFTSAYVVKRGDTTNWIEIILPRMFTISTCIILFSSLFMHSAYISFKKNKLFLYRIFMTLTFLAGASFLFLQIKGWEALNASGIDLTTNVSGSFIYVISGAHFVHVLGGIIALLVMGILSFTKYKTTVDLLMVNVDSDQQSGVSLMATFWHFIGFLWIYLFVFFQLN